MTTRRDEFVMKRFESLLWNLFRSGQSVRSVRVVDDLFSTGLLKSLMTKNMSSEVKFECKADWDGTYAELGLFQEEETFVVQAHPAQSVFHIFRDGAELAWIGPQVQNNSIVYSSITAPGITWPHILLEFDKIPDVWGVARRDARRNSYPRFLNLPIIGTSG